MRGRLELLPSLAIGFIRRIRQMPDPKEAPPMPFPGMEA